MANSPYPSISSNKRSSQAFHAEPLELKSFVTLTLDFQNSPERCQNASLELRRKGFDVQTVSEAGSFLVQVKIDLLGERGFCEQVEAIDRVADGLGGRIRHHSSNSTLEWGAVLSAERLAVSNAVRLGRSSEARDQLELLVSRGILPESTKSEWLGRAHLANGEIEEAKRYLRTSLTQSLDAEHRGRALLALGQTYFEDRDLDLAEDAWIECLATPSYNEARIGLARIKARQGLADIALTWLRLAVKQHPPIANELRRYEEFRTLESKQEFQSLIRPTLWQRWTAWIATALRHQVRATRQETRR